MSNSEKVIEKLSKSRMVNFSSEVELKRFSILGGLGNLHCIINKKKIWAKFMIKYKIFWRKCKCQKCIFMNNENRNHMPQEKEISIATKSLFLTLILCKTLE